MASVSSHISSLVDARLTTGFAEETNSSSVEAAIKRARLNRYVFKSDSDVILGSNCRKADAKKKRSQRPYHRYRPYPY